MKEIKQYTDIKSLEDALQVLGIQENPIPDFEKYPEDHKRSMIAHAELVLIVEAANMLANDGKRWEPDFSDPNQYKYEIWFIQGSGSSGFLASDYDGWLTYSGVGSRLCFVNYEVGKYVADTFIDTYNRYLKY